MPTYRSIDVVAESISSVLAQTFPDFELIVVDDASFDGAAEARGEFLAFLDADDPYFLWTLATRHEGIPGGELREILALLTKLLVGEGRPLRLARQVLVTTYGWASAKARSEIHRGIHRLRGVSAIDRLMHHRYRLGRLAQRLPLPKAITLRWLAKLYVVDELEKAGSGFPTLFSADLPLSEAHSLIGRRLLRYGIWEPALTANFVHRLREGDVTLDVGAHFGAHTVLASRLREGSRYEWRAGGSEAARLLRRPLAARADH